MNRNTKFLLAGTMIAIVIVAIGSFWFGSLQAQKSAGVDRVTVTRLADAMRQDNFYSTYGNSAVLFSAKVSAVRIGDNASLVSFSTNHAYGVSCQFPKSVVVKAGQTIAVAAPAGSAERQPHGVLLHNCLQN